MLVDPIGDILSVHCYEVAGVSDEHGCAKLYWLDSRTDEGLLDMRDSKANWLRSDGQRSGRSGGGLGTVYQRSLIIYVVGFIHSCINYI